MRAGWLCSSLVWRELWWPSPIVSAFPVILPQAADRSGWETNRKQGRKEKAPRSYRAHTQREGNRASLLTRDSRARTVP